MDPKDIRWTCAGWIDLVWDQDKWQDVVSLFMKLQVLKNAGNFFITWGSIGLSRMTLLHRVSICEHFSSRME
jgi:hypothetical protein